MKPLDLPLFATPATRQALVDSRAVAILVGGYDGSGNYGDIAQLDAALRLLKPLGAELLALPMVERVHHQAHRDLLETFQLPPEHALFFDPEGSPGHDDLLPVAVQPGLAAGAIYLYGGGYLNPAWGTRKLAMVMAAADLLQAAGVAGGVRVASGLQVDPAWIKELPAADAELLRSFELLGARDPLSARALAELGFPGAVLETADDALGAIPALAPATAGPEAPAKVVVNLHLGEHEWVSDRPGELRNLALDLIAELARRSGRSTRIRPLIAYLDGRIDERPQATALAAEAARRGIEIEEPRVLRPSDLEAVLPELGEATATICSSYHIALTSLLLGVPTVVFSDNPYYAQKVAGLTEAFRLPPSFAVSPGSDLDLIATTVLDDDAALREKIVQGGEELRRSRAKAEAEVLARLSGGLLAEMGTAVGKLGERLQERSAEPAELRVELAASRTEAEELREPAVDAAIVAAERRAERAEESARQAEVRVEQAAAENAATHRRLAEVLGARSWKIGAPLRRIGAAFRRLKHRG